MMEITSIKLYGTSISELDTEIKFNISEARVSKTDIFNLYFDETENKSSSGKISNIIRILKSEKRAGKIQLYILSSDLSVKSTESEYLFNKYPEILNIKFKGTNFIIKI